MKKKKLPSKILSAAMILHAMVQQSAQAGIVPTESLEGQSKKSTDTHVSAQSSAKDFLATMYTFQPKWGVQERQKLLGAYGDGITRVIFG